MGIQVSLSLADNWGYNKMMRLKQILVLLLLGMCGLQGCFAPHFVEPLQAQQNLRVAWQANQHAVWQLAWEQLPVGGPVVVEVWQVGRQYRWEILEAPTIQLVGATVIFNGHETWRYNRFEATPTQFGTTSPTLMPITAVFARVTAYLIQPPIAATRQANWLGNESETITLVFADETQLTMELATGLPKCIKLVQGNEVIILKARQMELLAQPMKGLFAP
jgi:hypothetical protein